MADETNEVRRPTYMLTTFDNPFDPFTQFDEWFEWDIQAGYNSSGMLDRVARLSDELSDADQHIALQDAIDEIVRENVNGMWRKVKRGDMVAVSSTSSE